MGAKFTPQMIARQDTHVSGYPRWDRIELKLNSLKDKKSLINTNCIILTKVSRITFVFAIIKTETIEIEIFREPKTQF